MKNTIKALALIAVLAGGTAVWAQDKDTVKVTFIAASGDRFDIGGTSACTGMMVSASPPPTVCEFTLDEIKRGHLQLTLAQNGVVKCNFTGGEQGGNPYFTGICGNQFPTFIPSTQIVKDHGITVNLPKIQ